MSQSRYFSKYPTINSSYLSAGATRDQNNFTFQDIVAPNDKAIASNVNIQTNSSETIFYKVNHQDLSKVNEPIQTSNFNVLRVSVDSSKYFDTNTDINREIFLDVLQGNSADNLEVSYTTPLKVPNVFYRNYPIKNNFCNVKFRNETSANVYIDYDIALSKFSQYAVPSQIGDQVEFKEMTNLVRNANDFYDDVSRDLYENSSIINRFGYFQNNVVNTQIVAPVNILENTSNTFVEVYAKSDSALDTFEFTIEGNTDILDTGRSLNAIELFGTSNSLISLSRFKYIDTVNLPQLNTGNISIYKNNTSELVAYIPKETSALSSPLYYINKIEEGVLKEVVVNGLTQLQNGSIEIRLDNNSSIKTIWSSGVLDGRLQNYWTPNYKIPSNSTVYAIVKDVNTNRYGNQRMDISLNILKYNLQPLLSL